MRQRLHSLLCCLMRGALAVAPLAVGSPGSAAETWPDQPYDPPRIYADRSWPGDVEAGIGFKGSFCSAGDLVYIRPNVRRGGLMSLRYGALFFPTRSDLDLFEGPTHALGPNVRILPFGHPLAARQDILDRSAGGLVEDDLFGEGFARWPRDSDERFPDWMELFHAGGGGACHEHPFVHFPPRADHQAFVRPRWPTIRTRHERNTLERDGRRLKLERGF